MSEAANSKEITAEKALYEFLEIQPDGNGEEALKYMVDKKGIPAQEAIDTIYKLGTLSSDDAKENDSKPFDVATIIEKVSELVKSGKVNESKAKEFIEQINAFTTTTDESSIVRIFAGNSATDSLMSGNMPDVKFKAVGNKTVTGNPAEESKKSSIGKEIRQFVYDDGPAKVKEVFQKFQKSTSREQFIQELATLEHSGYLEINNGIVAAKEMSIKKLYEHTWNELPRTVRERLQSADVTQTVWEVLRSKRESITSTSTNEKLPETGTLDTIKKDVKKRRDETDTFGQKQVRESNMSMKQLLEFRWGKLPVKYRKTFENFGLDKSTWSKLRKTREAMPEKPPIVQNMPQSPMNDEPVIPDDEDDHNGAHTKVYNAVKDNPDVEDPWRLANYVVHKNNMENLSRRTIEKLDDTAIETLVAISLEDFKVKIKGKIPTEQLSDIVDPETIRNNLDDTDESGLSLPVTEADAHWWWKNMSPSSRKDALKVAGFPELANDFSNMEQWMLLPENVRIAIQKSVMVQGSPDESFEAEDTPINTKITYDDGRKSKARSKAKPTDSYSKITEKEIDEHISSLEKQLGISSNVLSVNEKRAILEEIGLSSSDEQVINPRKNVLGFGPDGIQARNDSNDMITGDEMPCPECQGMNEQCPRCMGTGKISQEESPSEDINEPVVYADGRKSQARQRADPEDTVAPIVEDIDQGTYKCSVCNKDFLDQDDYSIHLKNHTQEANNSPYQTTWNNLSPLQRYFELNRAGLKGAFEMESWTSMFWESLPLSIQYVLAGIGTEGAFEMEPEYDIKVINKDSGDIIEQLHASNQFDAELLARNLSQNMNVNLYEIKIVPSSESVIDEADLIEKQISDTDTFPMSSLTSDEIKELSKLRKKNETGELSGQELTKMYELSKKSNEADWNSLTNDERANLGNKLRLSAMDIAKIVDMPIEEIQTKYPGIGKQLEAHESTMPKSCGCPVVTENYWKNADHSQRCSLLESLGIEESGESHLQWNELPKELQEALQKTIAKEERTLFTKEDAIMPFLKSYLTEQSFAGMDDNQKLKNWVILAGDKGFTSTEAVEAYNQFTDKK